MKEIIYRCDNCKERIDYYDSDYDRGFEGLLMKGQIETQINLRTNYGCSSFPTNNLGYVITETEGKYDQQWDEGVRICSPQCFKEYMDVWSKDMLEQWTKQRTSRVKKALSK